MDCCATAEMSELIFLFYRELEGQAQRGLGCASWPVCERLYAPALYSLGVLTRGEQPRLAAD